MKIPGIVFIVLLVISLVFLGACGGGETTTTTTQATSTSTTTTTTSAEPSTTEEPEPTTTTKESETTTQPTTTEPTTTNEPTTTAEPTTTPEPEKFAITSPAFEDEGVIPIVYSCDGSDKSPELNWTGVPDGTQSFVLIMDDPDAPGGTWVHWVIYNIPADATGLEEGVPKTLVLSGGTAQGNNSWGETGYGGPCPPLGQSHRYFFKLYALDITMLSLPAGATKAQVIASIKGHILDEAQLMGNFQS